jgi:C1A family cysteine protease
MALAMMTVPALSMVSHAETWATFKATYRKTYTVEEEASRFDIFMANLRIIEAENRAQGAEVKGITKFADLTAEEFKARYLMNTPRNKTEALKPWDGKCTACVRFPEQATLLAAPPTDYDWTEHGAVTPVKDQGQCGSCWAFSTTGSTEGAVFVSGKPLPSLSEQQLVDCDFIRAGGPSLGCNGGDMKSAMEWIGKNNGLCTESAYPYVSGDTKTNGPCQKTCSIVSGSDISTTVSVSANSDNAMMTALAQQPVSVAIEADQSSLQLYKSGVFTGTCGTNLDHGVLLIGYGTMNGLDYYIMKNSWDVTWGSQGFMYMARGLDSSGKPYNGGKGQCGLLMQGVYPVL